LTLCSGEAITELRATSCCGGDGKHGKRRFFQSLAAADDLEVVEHIALVLCQDGHRFGRVEHRASPEADDRVTPFRAGDGGAGTHQLDVGLSGDREGGGFEPVLPQQSQEWFRSLGSASRQHEWMLAQSRGDVG
jgi:hypothetical protein